MSWIDKQGTNKVLERVSSHFLVSELILELLFGYMRQPHRSCYGWSGLNKSVNRNGISIEGAAYHSVIPSCWGATAGTYIVFMCSLWLSWHHLVANWLARGTVVWSDPDYCSLCSLIWEWYPCKTLWPVGTIQLSTIMLFSLPPSPLFYFRALEENALKVRSPASTENHGKWWGADAFTHQPNTHQLLVLFLPCVNYYCSLLSLKLFVLAGLRKSHMGFGEFGCYIKNFFKVIPSPGCQTLVNLFQELTLWLGGEVLLLVNLI